MPHTDGRWTQGTLVPGAQFFVPAQRFKDLAGLATTPATIATPGLLWQLVPAGDACIFVAGLDELMLREPIYASPAYDQEQYGTAASVPGPTAVAHTNGPLGIPGSGTPNYQGFPPTPAALLTTLVGANGGGAGLKGIQIDSVDAIYQVLTDATAVAATIGLTKTTFSNLVAPVVTNLIALGAHSLPVIIGAQPQVTNVAVTTPAIITAADTEVLLNINLTGGTAGTIKFFGAVIKAHYNYN